MPAMHLISTDCLRRCHRTGRSPVRPGRPGPRRPAPGRRRSSCRGLSPPAGPIRAGRRSCHPFRRDHGRTGFGRTQDRRRGERRRSGMVGAPLPRYELMPAAVQTLAPTAVHSVEASMNLSLMTVEFMLETLTQTGVNSDAGWVEPVTPLGGLVVEFTNAVGGFLPARRMVASDTAS